MRDKGRKKHTWHLEAAKPPRWGLWREVLLCTLPALLHSSLCGQIRCSLSSWSLGTMATCNWQHKSIPQQWLKAQGWGGIVASHPFLGCGGDGEVLWGLLQPFSQVESKLPVCLSLPSPCVPAFAASSPPRAASQGHSSPSLAVPLAGSSHLKRLASKASCSSGFAPAKRSSLLILTRGCRGSH